jgi:hypothetical protein
VPVKKVRRVWSSNPAVVLWGTMVGKKVVMAVTGLVLIGFVVAHMLGNLKIFPGVETIDAYAVREPLAVVGAPQRPAHEETRYGTHGSRTPGGHPGPRRRPASLRRRRRQP